MASTSSVEASPEQDSRRQAGLWALIAVGYGAVISGDFFGWQLTLRCGFYNALIVFVAISLHYFALCVSIAEVAAALPRCNSAAQFVRDCLGTRWALTVAIVETIKILLVVDVITVGLSSYVVRSSDTSIVVAHLGCIVQHRRCDPSCRRPLSITARFSQQAVPCC